MPLTTTRHSLSLPIINAILEEDRAGERAEEITPYLIEEEEAAVR